MNDNLSRFARSYHEVRMADTQEELANASASFSIVAVETAMANITAGLVAEVHKELRTQTIWVAGTMIALAIGLVGLAALIVTN